MIKDLYMAAIVNNHQSLVLLLDYLINVKKVVSLEDSEEKLNYYLEERFQNKMNEYLDEYNETRKIIQATNEVNVYCVRLFDTFFYVASHNKEEAATFFKEEYGEADEIKIEIPELEVENKEGRYTLRQILMKTKSFPSILGCWDLYEVEHGQKTRS